MAENATVGVYAEASLCEGADAELAAAEGQAGDLRVRIVCLGGEGKRWRVGAVASGARRAAEDSSAVAYIGSTDPTAIRFYRPILEEAGIADLATTSGSAALAEVLRALNATADSDSPRDSLHDELG